MSIHFSPSRWEKIRNTYDLWWNRKLDRPLLIIRILNTYESDGIAPNFPLLSQSNCHDFSIPPEEIINAMDYNLQKIEYLGDSFPSINFDCFGPGVLAAFCGAVLDNSRGRVWFFPEKRQPIEELHVKYDPENKWVKRIKDIYLAGNEKWQGQVQMGMPDLGGILDVAATFRTTEQLLLDLYESPEEVLRLCGEIQNAWHEAYRDMRSVLDVSSPGYTDWKGLFSSTPSYVLQSDFSYMISPEMFRTFTLPFLIKDCDILDHTIYHLDGIGQIPHLDMLLSLENLNAIQWVYGAGKPGPSNWIDLYKRIEEAGKCIDIDGSADDFMAVYSRVKKGLCIQRGFYQKDRAAAEELLKAFGEI